MAEEMEVEVILDIFSGQPNPCWRLTEEQARELARLLSMLVQAPDRRMAEPPGLGYRGFQVQGLEAPVSVFAGRVERSGTVLLDQGRAIERWLFESAETALPPSMRDYVRQEIGR